MSGITRHMTARERRLFDVECWNLHRRGYSFGYISARTGATVGEVVSAVRRVECGRYGEVRKFEEGRS